MRKKISELSAKDFLIDLIPQIKENLADAKQRHVDDYEAGLVFAY